MSFDISVPIFCFLDNISKTTYLCSVLGSPYAEIHDKQCLPEMRLPNGKILPISFIGIIPYIKYKPFGGSEPLVIQMLARKYGFIPHFI